MAIALPADPTRKYSFNFETTDEFGNTYGRSESQDEFGEVTGTDFYILANGIFRSRNYVANDFGNFVKILSNEPGLSDEDPGHVQIVTEPVPAGVQPEWEGRSLKLGQIFTLYYYKL